MRRKHFLTILVAVVIVAALLLKMFVYQVRTNELTVKLRFGNPVESPVQEGPHFRWPWPIERINAYDGRLQINETKQVEQQTRDRHTIIYTVCVGWRIADVNIFNKNFGAFDDEPMEEAWARFNEIIRQDVSAALSTRRITQLVSAEAESLAYADVENEARKMANAKTLKSYGVEVQLLKVKRLELPDSVRSNIYQRMIAERVGEASDIENDGKARAQVITDAADAAGEEIRSRAKKIADKIKAEGHQRAAVSYRVYAADPALAIHLRKLEAWKKLNETRTTLIIDTTAPPFDALFKFDFDASGTPGKSSAAAAIEDPK